MNGKWICAGLAAGALLAGTPALAGKADVEHKAKESTVTLVLKDIEAQEAVSMIAKLSGVEIQLVGNVEGLPKITANFSGATVLDAATKIAALLGMEVSVGDDGIRIGPQQPAESSARRGFGFVPAGKTELAAYLGVGTSPAGEAMGKQLALPRGVGLTVDYVDPKSPAAGKLEQHDVLHKLNDQILVNHGQLAVLIRMNKPGEKVKLTVLRGGKEKEVEVELAEKELPPLMTEPWGMRWDKTFPKGPVFRFQGPGMQSSSNLWKELRGFFDDSADDDDQETTVNPKKSGGKSEDTGVRIRIQGTGKGGVSATGNNAAGFRVMSRSGSSASSTVSMNDGAHSLTLTTSGKSRTLRATDADGKVLFEGPVDTEEQVSKVPEDIRAKFKEMDKVQGGLIGVSDTDEAL